MYLVTKIGIFGKNVQFLYKYCPLIGYLSTIIGTDVNLGVISVFTEYFCPSHSRITVSVLIFDEIQSPIVKSRFHQLALERPIGWGSSSSSVSISRIAPLNQPKSEKFLFTQFTTDFKIYYKTRLLEKKSTISTQK